MTSIPQAVFKPNRIVLKAKSCGFTLIELLTVIAIIGILSAIVIASVQSVRRSATKASATSDLRSIYMAIVLYSQENKNQLPGPSNTAINGGYQNKLAPQLSKFLGPYLTQSIHVASGWFQVKEFTPSNYQSLAKVYDDIIRGPAYIINTDTFSDPNYSLPFGHPQTAGSRIYPQKLTSIPNPSRDVCLYGLDALNLEGSPGWADRVAKQPLFGDKRPFLYWDGHVEISQKLRPE